MAIDIEDRREQFFRYFRSRHQVAARNDIPLPDRLVILSASLDALAKHWAESLGTNLTTRNHLERMWHFLVNHGGHPAFRKVSAPLLRDDTGVEVVFPFGEYDPNGMNEVRNWENDPDIETAEEAAGQDVRRWSYPGILYIDLRCAWVHEFAGTNTALYISEANFFGRDEPYYRFVANVNKYILMMPVPFLLNTLELAIGSFAQEAQARRVLPFAEKPA